jgi:hypothetical protein
MAEVRRLEADAFEEVHGALLQPHDPSISRSTWRLLFNPPWHTPEPTIGYGLVDRTQGLVGFIGTLRSDVEARGRMFQVCNLTSWVVRPEFRTHSMALVLPELRREDVTFTNLTPIPAVHTVFSRLGFSVLESSRTVCRVQPALGRWRTREVVTDPERIRPLLDPGDRRVLDDHRGVARHLYVADPDLGTCYVLYAMVRRRRFPCARVYHVGNVPAFRRLSRILHRQLFRLHGAVYMDFDSRLVRGESIARSRKTTLGIPRMYRSRDLEPDEIPCTYSELVLLNI